MNRRMQKAFMERARQVQEAAQEQVRVDQINVEAAYYSVATAELDAMLDLLLGVYQEAKKNKA